MMLGHVFTPVTNGYDHCFLQVFMCCDMIGDPTLFYTRSSGVEVTRVSVLEIGCESVERDHG